jgi:predicted transcriptional regulator
MGTDRALADDRTDDPARELDRDVKRVHDDVSMLIKHGLMVRTADRKICVPYDVIHADFDLRAVA